MGTDRTALIVVDMQEDFCSETGAYARSGLDVGATRGILPTVDAAILGAHRRGMPQIATLFTVYEDFDGSALLAPHLAAHRPFLREYGFRIGDQGREFSREITAPSHTLSKVRYSAFYCTPLDVLLRSMGISKVAVCGITAGGGVAATVRDGHLRDLEITVLYDGVASFSEQNKQEALAMMKGVATLATTEEWLETL